MISHCNNALIFHHPDYIDAFCQWDVIVLDDYEGGIILPITKSMGMSKIYQPAFIQKCAWLGDSLLPDEEVRLFDLIKSQNNWYHFNTSLKTTSKCKSRINQILPLTNYEEVRKQYSKSLRKNIDKNTKDLITTSGMDAKQTVGLYQKAYGKLNPHLKQSHYEALVKLTKSNSELFNNVHVYKDNEVVASLLFAKYNNRLHYILGAPSAEGRKLNALSVGLDYIIRENCDGKSTLDFEGSSIPSVYNYYKSFGALEETFYEVEYSPYMLRLLISIYNKLAKS